MRDGSLKTAQQLTFQYSTASVHPRDFLVCATEDILTFYISPGFLSYSTKSSTYVCTYSTIIIIKREKHELSTLRATLVNVVVPVQSVHS
jgi:hypothetical protein